MSEDSLVHNGIAALTRRFEDTTQKTDREFGIVKSDLIALRLQVGNLDQKVDDLAHSVSGLTTRLDDFIDEQRRTNATLVELLTRLAGKDPNAD